MAGAVVYSNAIKAAPTARWSAIANFWHRKKPNDHMRQARRTHHQRQSDGKEIENIPPALLGVGRESQLTIQSFQFGQHAGFFTAPSEAELWNGKSQRSERKIAGTMKAKIRTQYCAPLGCR